MPSGILCYFSMSKVCHYIAHFCFRDGPLTNECRDFWIDDPTWQKMEVILHRIHNNCMPCIIASLRKKKVLIVLDTEDKWRHSTDGINSFHLQLCSFHFAADKRSTWNLPHPGNLLNLVCQTWQFSHEYFHGDFWMVLWFIKVQMLWSTMFLAVLRQTHKHSRMCKHF